MIPVTLKELLLWTSHAHKQLADDLEQAREGTGDEPLSYLLDYLAEHEERLAESVRRFIADSPEQLLGTRIQHYLETRLPSRDDLHLGAVNGAAVDAVTGRIVDCHNQLIQLYRDLSTQVELPRVSEVLEEIRELEEREIHLLYHQANRMHDL